jgi:hypothetical protein
LCRLQCTDIAIELIAKNPNRSQSIGCAHNEKR